MGNAPNRRMYTVSISFLYDVELVLGYIYVWGPSELTFLQTGKCLRRGRFSIFGKEN